MTLDNVPYTPTLHCHACCVSCYVCLQSRTPDLGKINVNAFIFLLPLWFPRSIQVVQFMYANSSSIWQDSLDLQVVMLGREFLHTSFKANQEELSNKLKYFVPICISSPRTSVVSPQIAFSVHRKSALLAIITLSLFKRLDYILSQNITNCSL